MKCYRAILVIIYIFMDVILMRYLGTQTIEIERLILRRFKINDAKDMFNNWTSDKDVTK